MKIENKERRGYCGWKILHFKLVAIEARKMEILILSFFLSFFLS